MEREVINPWTWQDQFGFVQANKLTGPERLVIFAGQLSVDGEGNTLHPGDMGAQVSHALDNIETVVKAAGLQPSDIVSLRYYTTDLDGFIAAGPTLGQCLGAWGCRPAATLLGVSRLAVPGCMIEIEAMAAA
jgi:enamine deaminase RidA (YjgF/YER057c/UK114 family)